jgi:hypothetical protein
MAILLVDRLNNLPRNPRIGTDWPYSIICENRGTNPEIRNQL